MNKKQRLKQEKEFQDKRVLHKEDKRFLTDLHYLINSFKKRILLFKNKRILNIGCGTGTLTIELARNKNKLSAIDISPESVKVLKTQIRKEKLGKYASALLMDAENLKFKANTFDMIYGIAILHHLDFKKVLPELKRVIKKNGKLFFIEPTAHNPIINKYRAKTPHMRSKFEHPLSRQDIKVIKEYFPKVNIKGFYLVSSLVPYSIRSKRFLNYLDTAILAIFPFLKLYCYSIIIEMQN